MTSSTAAAAPISAIHKPVVQVFMGTMIWSPDLMVAVYARFVGSVIKDQGLWQQPLDNLCQRASQIRVKDVMYTPAQGEYVQEDATLNEGIHQLIVGHHQSLLVARDSKIVGVLRLSDVFFEISAIMKASPP